MESIKRITDLLNSIPITPNNKKEIEGAKQAIVEWRFPYSFIYYTKLK